MPLPADPWTDMPYGVDGDFTSVEITWGYGELEIPYGLDIASYFNTRTFSLKTTQDDRTSAGIQADAGSLGGSGKLTSVSLTATERMPDPIMVARNPGDDISTTSGYLQMALADSALYLGTEYSYSLAGDGVAPLDKDAQGTIVGAKTFNAAHGTFAITTHTQTVLKQVAESRPNNTIRTWTAELGCKVAATSPGSSHVLTPPTEYAALIPANMVGRYTNTQSMSDDESSRPQIEWSGEFWPTA